MHWGEIKVVADILAFHVSGQDAKEGTLHILREAVKAGIEKIVVTGTAGNLINRASSAEYPWI
jgi:tyrosine-protein phosphatase YwqE